MAASLSEDEFQRMQTQLIELRSNNYTYEEKHYRQNAEIGQLRNQIENLEKDLNKAQKAINRSKKARDIEQILQDNESLQHKLQNQEDEFRLQNTTLMQELSSLVSSNEQLEKQIIALETEKPNSPDVSSGTDEIRRLQAEKAALQKSLFDEKTRYETEMLVKSTPCGDLVETENSADDSTLDDDQKLQAKELSEVKLLLYTELEEKKILKEQLASIENTLNEKVKDFEMEIKKLSEKLKKKQESILQLQEEKETLFTENKSAFDELHRTKTVELENIKEQLQRFQGQYANLNQMHQDYKQKAETTQQTLQNELEKLKTEISQQSADAILILETKVSSLESELGRVNAILIEKESESKLLQCHLEASQSGLLECQSKLQTAVGLQLKAEQTASEAVLAAEKRKQLLDQMAVHLQEESDKHKMEINSTEHKYNEKLNQLEYECNSEKLKNETFETMKLQFSTQQQENESHQRRITDLEGLLSDEKKSASIAASNFETCMDQRTQDNNSLMSKLEEEHIQETELLNVQLEELKTESQIKESSIAKHQQDIKDLKEEMRIQEKKGISMVKELKKQLLGERRRADKLQERLQEYLSENSSSKIDIMLPGLERSKGDTSSVSSWSFMSGNLDVSKESKNGSKERISEDGANEKVISEEGNEKALEDEHNELFARITALQQEKWILEEKLNHLEGSNAAMADDIMSKTAIIQYYCMEGRANSRHLPANEKLTVKRIVDFIKDKGDENLKEINRKMQRMLEETLTKNMFLQKDLEFLSTEVVQLSKITGSKPTYLSQFASTQPPDDDEDEEASSPRT